MSDNYDRISECFFQMDPVNSKLVAQFSVAFFTGCRLPYFPLPIFPKWLPKFPLPILPVAHFSVAHFSVAQISVAYFTIYLLCHARRYTSALIHLYG